MAINPADNALLIATHSGLWRVPPGETTPSRIGESRQDTMGFTVVGPDHFLASGHPEAAEVSTEAPPHLGLIESRDGGQEWERVSLAGEADLHVLRRVGKHLIAINALDGQLIQSGDRGRTWTGLAAPTEFFDFVASPDGRRWVASAPDGLYGSDDAGASWVRFSPRTGLLAWPTRQVLYLVAADGVVFSSRDGGSRFARRGTVATPAAVLATDAKTLFVAAHQDGTVYVTRDGGRTWSVRSRPPPARSTSSGGEDD